MGDSSKFKQIYRDPRWQRKRLEIMSRDEFGCTQCGVKTVTLNVHHRYYTSGHAPWEYPNDALQTLCENCHEKVTDVSRRIKEQLGRLDCGALCQVLGYAVGIEAIGQLFGGGPPPPGLKGMPLVVHDAFTMGVAAALGLPDHLHVRAADQDGAIEYEKLIAATEEYVQEVYSGIVTAKEEEGGDH